MLAGHDLVDFGDVWGGLMRNRHNLMRVFARTNRVLFVERRPHLRPSLRRLWRGELSPADLVRPPLTRIAENLHVFRYPAWAPVSGQFPLKPLTRAVQRRMFQRALRQLGFVRPIVWFYHPEWLDLLAEVPEPSLRVYHVVDDYTSYQGLTDAARVRIAERERRMAAAVDAVVVVSPALYEARRQGHARTLLVPNGVDFPAYTQALRDPRLPEALTAIRPPRLGYSGLIGDKLALEALYDLARDNPAWSFVLLGDVNASKKLDAWRALLALPNAHYLGVAPWDQVPHYLKGLSVGLMPYVQDRHSDTISPLKLYDYLAAGLPIAAVDIPAVREFSAWVSIAERPEALGDAIRRALAEAGPERCQARREIAAQHSWEARAELISQGLQALLPRPAAGLRMAPAAR
jgi:glycosyltransferase involved in cell wall biosynthesis